jgi:hypothetical protein
MSSWIQWPIGFTLPFSAGFQEDFPHLIPSACVGDFSPYDESYNCIAWAANEANVRWDPDPFLQYYWPPSVPRELTLDALIAAYKTVGFEVCADDSLEEGKEKIAIYALDGEPKHAARLLENGNWTSKMGDFEDIEHPDSTAVCGPLYGFVALFMSRPVAA